MRLKSRASVRSQFGPWPGVLAGLLRAGRVLEVVGAEAVLADAAVDHRIREAADVTRGLPDARMQHQRRVERDDVVALLHHRAQPRGLDVALHEHAVVRVVVGRAEAAVDLRGREDEAAAAAERDDGVHRHRLLRGRLAHARSVQSALPGRVAHLVQGLARTPARQSCVSDDLADPARQLAVRRDDQRADLALVVARAFLDRARRDERAARPVPRERELALPLARQRDVAGRRLALERGRDDLLERARLARLVADVAHGAREPGRRRERHRRDRDDRERAAHGAGRVGGDRDGGAGGGEHRERRQHAPDVVGRDLPAHDDHEQRAG